MNRTMMMIKPDAMSSNFSDLILDEVRKQFTIIAYKIIKLNRAQASILYSEHSSASYFNNLVDFTCSGPILVAVLEATEGDSIQSFRDLIGPKNPSKCTPEQIRYKYGQHPYNSAPSGPCNAVHGSADYDSAQKEIAFFFSQHELIQE